MRDVYEARPFQTRNADEFHLADVLSLFVSPNAASASPFDYANTIVKGRMGSGKTMYLRANHAYYLYSLVPALLEDSPPIIPVFVRLSDFQHLRKADEIYRSVILLMVEEIANAARKLENTRYLADMHRGMQLLRNDDPKGTRLSQVGEDLLRLRAEDFVRTTTREFGLGGGVKAKLLELSAQYRDTELVQLRTKSNPGIRDVERAYDFLLGDQDGRLLVLIDEAGSLDRSFFDRSQGPSPFEILMNQLRTASYTRTKIAIYPNSYQDVLAETRYGDLALLDEDVRHDPGYRSFRERAIALADNYIRASTAGNASVADHDVAELFELTAGDAYGDGLEQLINASNGNMRRLVLLFDASMAQAFRDHAGEGRVCLGHVLTALSAHASETLGQYPEGDRAFLDSLVQACKSRRTYRFKFPYKSSILARFTSRSAEHNLVEVAEMGAGRKGTTYAFDYALCIAKQIPTHYVCGTERIDPTRSQTTGQWIERVAQMSENILAHAQIATKIDGEITFLVDSRSQGVIKGQDGELYFFAGTHIIEDDKRKALHVKGVVRFVPVELAGARVAMEVEVL